MRSMPQHMLCAAQNLSLSGRRGRDRHKRDPNLKGRPIDSRLALEGGGLDGCTVDALEQQFPRDGGAWGTFYIIGKAACLGGDGFAYNAAGAWESKQRLSCRWQHRRR